MESFLLDPLSTYEKIIDYYGGDEDSAKYFVYTILRELFSHRQDLADKAYICIVHRDDKCTRDVIRVITGE